MQQFKTEADVYVEMLGDPNSPIQNYLKGVTHDGNRDAPVDWLEHARKNQLLRCPMFFMDSMGTRQSVTAILMSYGEKDAGTIKVGEVSCKSSRVKLAVRIDSNAELFCILQDVDVVVGHVGEIEDMLFYIVSLEAVEEFCNRPFFQFDMFMKGVIKSTVKYYSEE